ncbi:prothoracicostatic peptide-like [Ditylenchus destructor]|uniref:Prothoracicostatic peptide-like n=1 Tax=Ditylenchus destructor TaxID=166010 RepID=A0AAD4R1Q5_9BILA|nr:prothoracicostatic peptide-like [Ditylenchus destructor]
MPQNSATISSQKSPILSTTNRLSSWILAVFISLSVLLSLSDAVAEVYIPAVARSDDAMRRWSNGVGLWGKRSASPYPQDIGSWNEKRAATFQIDSNPEVARFLSKRPEDSWNKLNSLWGKRSSNWQTANGLWGKRSSPSGHHMRMYPRI